METITDDLEALVRCRAGHNRWVKFSDRHTGTKQGQDLYLLGSCLTCPIGSNTTTYTGHTRWKTKGGLQ